MLSTLSFSVSQNKQKTFPVFLSSCGGVITRKGHRDTCLLLLLPQHFLFSKHPLLFFELDRNKDGKQNLYYRLNSDVRVPYGFCHIFIINLQRWIQEKVVGSAPPPPSTPQDEAFFIVFDFKICLFHRSVAPFLSAAPLAKKNARSAPN